MSTRRAVVPDDEEQKLNQGDVSGAREAYRRAQVKTQESAAMFQFLRSHPEILPIQANESLLLDWCDRKKAFATTELLELALAELRDSLAIAPPAAPELTAAEIAALERKRLLCLSLDELHAEVRQRDLKKRIPTDFLSEDVAALRTRADIRRLPAAVLRNMLYRSSGGIARRLNTLHIESILNGSN